MDRITLEKILVDGLKSKNSMVVKFLKKSVLPVYKKECVSDFVLPNEKIMKGYK